MDFGSFWWFFWFLVVFLVFGGFFRFLVVFLVFGGFYCFWYQMSIKAVIKMGFKARMSYIIYG
jgi:hypothetical protein